MFSKLFFVSSTRALHLPRRCTLVSYSSPHIGRIDPLRVYVNVSDVTVEVRAKI